LKWTERREKVGFKTTPLDIHQTESTLEQTLSGISQLERDVRMAENRLCVLMGMPPTDLRNLLGEDRIPAAPPELAIGIPAELLRRRPDVRRAERQATAQSQAIGIAQADLYPAFSLGGTLGWQSQDFSDLFSGKSLDGNVGPSFQWKILNYGRIASNIRYHDAKFQELVTVYQQTVLQAAEEAEDGLVTFLQAQDRARHLERAVAAATAAVRDMFLPTALGRPGFDFNRFALIAQNRIVQQDLLAQSRGEIAQGLIQVYRALGGGWEIRLEPAPEVLPPPDIPPSVVPEGAEELQKLRNLLDSPTGQPVPAPKPLPTPPAELPQP
jgi:outer membrane protein TolC